MIKFRCKECQHKIAVPNDYEGRYVKCPACAAPTLVKAEPIEVQTTDAARAVPASAGAATATVAKPRTAPRRAAAPAAAPIPEGRPVADGQLAGSQASELLKALDDRKAAKAMTVPDPLTLDLEVDAADGEPDPPAATPHHHVPHAHPPQYVLLQVVGVVMLCFAGIGTMLWLIGLIVIAAGSAAVEEIRAVGMLAIAPVFVSGLLSILMLAGAGAALLALRDIARHSWYHKETAALLRQP